MSLYIKITYMFVNNVCKLISPEMVQAEFFVVLNNGYVSTFRFRVNKMIDPTAPSVDLLALNKNDFSARSLHSMDLEDLQEWVEGAGED